MLATTRFDSAENLEQTLKRYERIYNPPIPQKALGHIAPIQALKNWQEPPPRLFKKKVYNLTGLDRATFHLIGSGSCWLNLNNGQAPLALERGGFDFVSA